MPHYNFRDIGGIPTRNGQKVSCNHIFRSANPDKLRLCDRKHLESLNIRTIIDLRPEHEQKRKKQPPSLLHTITVPIAITEITKKRVRPYILKRNSAEKIIDIINSVYIDMIHNFQPQIKTIFNLLSGSENYPFLIHCRAGKDRTGFIIALILMLLDVDRQMIITDYLSSNDFIIPYVRKFLRPFKILSLGLFPSRNFEAMFTVRSRYLHTIFDIITDEYNGITGYLASCGISNTEQNKIISLLTEK